MKKTIFLAGLLGAFLTGSCFAESAEGPCRPDGSCPTIVPLSQQRKVRPAETQPSGQDLGDVQAPISAAVGAAQNSLTTRKKTSPADAVAPAVLAHLQPRMVSFPADDFPSQSYVDDVKIRWPGQTAPAPLVPETPVKFWKGLIDNPRIDERGRMLVILWARRCGVKGVDDDYLRKVAAKPESSPAFREAVRTFIKTKTWQGIGV